MAPSIGIIGAGQLATMLAQECRLLKFPVYILARSKNEPACKLADKLFVDSSPEKKISEEWLSFQAEADIVIFENEFLSEEQFDSLEKRRAVFPAPQAMMKLSDKAKQKELFKKLGVQTSDFSVFSPGQDAQQCFNTLKSRFEDGFVIKWAKGGYDGYGIQVVKPDHFKSSQLQEKATHFLEKGLQSGNQVYGERIVDFNRELALVSCRSRDGKLQYYPLVESIQENGICRSVISLTTKESKTQNLQQQAENAAAKIAEAAGILGTFALEFFQKGDDLLVNELAPRVHNSGHCTLSSAQTNQFKNHILAVSGNPLGEINSKEHFAMINILGPTNHAGQAEAPPLSGGNLAVIWYNKMQSRPGRKMGHINILADTRKELLDSHQEVLTKLKIWEANYPRVFL